MPFASYTLAFAPFIGIGWLIAFAILALAILGLSLTRRARGAIARAIAFTVLIAMLTHPMLLHETRQPLTDIVALIVDRSQSQTIGTRARDTERAATALSEQIKRIPGLELRQAEVSPSNDANGTALFAAIDAALGQVPSDRIAGVIALTDGEVHDAPGLKNFSHAAPLHVLLTGAPDERDRKLTIVRAERFALVGGQALITVRVDDLGGSPAGNAMISLHVDGVARPEQIVPLGHDTDIRIPVGHAGENVVEVEASPGPAEETLQNNRAVVVVNGVRDRLRVLLVSGEPHPGERVWRNLLKADPSVDLIHFTILRPPEKQDATPLNELSLIAFPTRELFEERLRQFDLVIFDRYINRGILPLSYFDNIAHYVEDGGALLISAGPEFSQSDSIYNTPLASVLPAAPSGDLLQQAFKPLVTQAGQAHPVTHDLSGANTADHPPSWGQWFRVIGAKSVSGTVVMEGPDHRPLLVLDRVKQGRVAELLSDQAWLWARGYDGGGPQAELLRRLAHWLMKEPDLEEEKLSASVAHGELLIERRTMAVQPPPVTITSPSGARQTVTLESHGAGSFSAHVPANELGLYRLADGQSNAVAAAGPLNPLEMSDVRATDSLLKPYADASGGTVRWIKDGIPALRMVQPGVSHDGTGWIGLTRRGASRVTAVEATPLLPPWAGLILALGAIAFAWRREAR